MAQDIVGSLFGVSANDLQAQRQQAAQAQAMRYAQMNPAEQVNYGGYMAGNQVGNALMGMMGAKDPELEKANMVNSLVKETDMTDLDSVKGLAQKLTQAGATREAMALLPRIDSLQSKAEDRQNKLDVAASKKTDIVLELVKSGKYKPASIAKFKESGDMSDLEMIDGTKTDRKTSWQTINGKRVLVDDQTGEEIKVAGSAGKSLGEELGAGLGQLGNVLAGAFAKKQAEYTGSETGKEIGKQTAMVQGKYDALTALGEAQKALTSGIYAGGYGPFEEVIAKYSPIGSNKRLENTELYRTVIGEVVIPRLQEFGGNDSVEELKYLRQVMAGETTLEPKVLARRLASAEAKIKAGIARLEQQGAAVQSGQMPSVGPVTPNRTATMRFNPATGKLEKVQ